MIVSDPFDGWGNKLLQYCFARSLGRELDYFVKCRQLPYLKNSGNFNYEGTKIFEPVVQIGHHSKYRHYVDIEELKDMTPCSFNIRSYLEYYPNIEKYKNEIVTDWCYIHNNMTSDDLTPLRNNFKQHDGNRFTPVDIESITSNDLVLSIRLGRDYLGQHRYRLLTGDYFKIILDNTEYDRVFITSQDPYNNILADLLPYNPVYLDHTNAINTFNFVRLFNNIALSQSTYSWWAAYLSDADNIYFPITKDGPWSYGINQRSKWKDFRHDLMVDEPRYKYVSYIDRDVIGSYKQTKDHLGI